MGLTLIVIHFVNSNHSFWGFWLGMNRLVMQLSFQIYHRTPTDNIGALFAFINSFSMELRYQQESDLTPEN